MEQFIAAAVTELLKYGLPGLAMAYLIYENRQLKADVEAKAQHIEQLQEKRVNEAIKTVMTLGRMPRRARRWLRGVEYHGAAPG